MSSVYEHYRFLGGSLTFTADVSGGLDCGCEAGVFLSSPDGDCFLNGFEQYDERVCPTIDVMRANGFDFITGSDNCPNGECVNASSCKVSANDANPLNFCLGAECRINPARPF